ncbi:hypothetical protein [Anoxybacterium hadale]|uniref:hypothetical protein n=1 Tax=Anoxybacterium hadale TaxID=3408580 RepID=UPI003B00B0E5
MFQLFKKKPSNLDPTIVKVLEAKRCGECRHNCKLSAPRCGKGKRQAAEIIGK